MRLHRVRRKYGAELNMTPMIDIIFQLIIFFMVVSQFKRIAVEALTLPEAKKGEPPPQTAQADPITINVFQDGRIVIYGKTLAPDAVQSALEEQVKGQDKSKVSVVVRSDKEAPWEAAAGVLQACAGAGISRVRVAVTEAKDATPKP